MSPENAARSGLAVLVVEDEAMVAMLIEDMLDELGHKTAATVGRLDAALAAAREGVFDMAVVDLSLRGVETYPVAEALRARGIPFLFATGYGTSALDPEWQDTPLLQKPFQTAELGEAIARLVGG